MKNETSAGIILIRKEQNHIRFLLLEYLNHWGFPKGIIEKGETIEETVKRELKEETGISEFKLIPNFKEEIEFFFKFKGESVHKKVHFLLGETKEEKVKISFEHKSFKWASTEEALTLLKFENDRELIRKALETFSKK